MSKVPTWFLLGAAAVGSAVGVALLTMDKKIVVEIDLSNKSMRPALGERTRFVVDPSWLAERRRKAVVAFAPPGRDDPCVARVVALPGDRMKVRGGRLYVNGRLHAVGKPPNVAARRMRRNSMPEFVCPAGCVYLLVDNPSWRRSKPDSVHFGPLPVWRVLGSLD